MKRMPEFASLVGLDLDLINVPKDTPVNLIMNLHPRDVKTVIQAYVDGVLQGQPREKFAELRTGNHAQGQQRMMASSSRSTCARTLSRTGATPTGVNWVTKTSVRSSNT